MKVRSQTVKCCITANIIVLTEITSIELEEREAFRDTKLKLQT